MGTRSTIALEFADGTVQQVYCHWDGYLQHNGRLLLQHWSDPFKLRDLIDLGDMSKLGAEIGEQHSFHNPHPFGTPEFYDYQDRYSNMCTFYGRDRGETGVESREFADYDSYVRDYRSKEEFDYILRADGMWYVSMDRTNFSPLLEELKSVELE
jgi:hypothetical protein